MARAGRLGSALRRGSWRSGDERQYSGLAYGGSGVMDLGGATKEYYDYRRALYGDVTHKALLVDAVGTLVVPSQSTAQVFLFDGF